MAADFSGYATKNGLKCSDGRIIDADAFKEQDGLKVPLVWQHQHNEPHNVLGHAMLENRVDGVYAYGYFNTTDAGVRGKELVKHGDINALSIYANKLVQKGPNVIHGAIREVSLVLTGANPGALIDNVNLQHSGSGDSSEGDAIIYTGLNFGIAHSDDEGDTVATTTSDMTVKEVFDSMTEEQQNITHFLIGEALTGEDPDLEHADEDSGAAAGGKTVKDVFDSMSEEQKNVVYFMIGEALKGDDAEDNDKAGDSGKSAQHINIDSDFIQHSIQSAVQEGLETMSRNVFEQNNETKQHTLTHAEVQTLFADAQKFGTLKEALEHANYGIESIDLLFPDAKTIGNNPELISRRMEWVSEVLTGTKHSPFAKIKSITADVTAEEARAKGYIKGKLKKDEVVKMLRRTTAPTTVYKKQKLDRDDILDITDMDVVAWLKAEIRMMLEEEIARAILFGDGRDSLSDDKIKDPEGAVDGTGIRSIMHEHELYAVKADLPANVAPKDAVKGMVRARSKYRGTGKPTLFISDAFLTDIMLEEDKFGRALYETEQSLADKLRVSKIVTVDIIDDTENLLAIMVNLADYTIGANKGGELTSFEDFDIDYNQHKYLTETRISGALTKPFSAVILRRLQGTLAAAPAPSFNGVTNTITVPVSTGVDYLIDGVVVTGDVVIAADTEVTAAAAVGYYLAPNATKSWTFTYTAA